MYMVADGPSGNQILDDIALSERSDIIHAAIPDSGKGPNKDIYVAVQLDLSDQNGILRLAVDGDVQRIPEGDAAATDTLESFFDFVQKQCPARHYAVLFWGHSSGPVGLFGDTASIASPLNRVTLPKLQGVMEHFAEALRKGRESFKTTKRDCARRAHDETGSGRGAAPSPADDEQPIDILVFKNCWVGTLEAAYQLRGLGPVHPRVSGESASDWLALEQSNVRGLGKCGR